MLKNLLNKVKNTSKIYLIALLLIGGLGILNTIQITDAANKNYALVSENMKNDLDGNACTNEYYLSDSGNVYVRLCEYNSKTGDISVKTKKRTYKSSNKNIATVSKKGKVTFKKPGKVVISCKYNKNTYKTTLYVKDETPYLTDELFNKYNNSSIYATGKWVDAALYYPIVNYCKETNKEHCYIYGWDILQGDLTGEKMSELNNSSTFLHIEDGIEVAIPLFAKDIISFDKTTRNIIVNNYKLIFHGYVYLNRTKVSIYINCNKDNFEKINYYERKKRGINDEEYINVSPCISDLIGFYGDLFDFSRDELGEDDYKNFECETATRETDMIGRRTRLGSGISDKPNMPDMDVNPNIIIGSEQDIYSNNRVLSFEKYNSYKKAIKY